MKRKDLFRLGFSGRGTFACLIGIGLFLPLAWPSAQLASIISVKSFVVPPVSSRPAATTRENPACVKFVITGKSKVELKGSTNIGSWQSESASVKAVLRLGTSWKTLEKFLLGMRHLPLRSALYQNKTLHQSPVLPFETPSVGVLNLPIRSLHGGNPGMDHDMRHALKAKNHPFVRYEFLKLGKASVVLNAQRTKAVLILRIIGKLSIAGKSRLLKTTVVVHPVWIKGPGQRRSRVVFHIHALTKMRMRDFGITPPTAFWGLIRANQVVFVVFKLNLIPVESSPLRRDLAGAQRHSGSVAQIVRGSAEHHECLH